ncbi:MAG TPA: 3'-5' exonuclease [Egibacteraceae bacterium]|nr:3'-5' exonuclease [Egibacteraceae bacterium]
MSLLRSVVTGAHDIRRVGRSRRLPWRECEFVVMDFELTDLNPRRAKPLSVGWVVVRHGRMCLADAGYTPIHWPGGPGEISPEAVAVHGLLPEDLAAAPAVSEVADQLERMVTGRVLVAHGSYMELTVLRRVGVPVARRRALDTIRLSQSLDRLEEAPVPANRTLSALSRRLGLPAHRPHHAFGDALTTGGVFLALATRLEAHGAGRLGDLHRLGGA